MSTLLAPPSPSPSPPKPSGPFLYGWRDIFRRDANGVLVHDQIPLTLEDVLHPQMGDVISEGSLHDNMRMYVANIARARLAHDPTALVLSDTGVYWDIEELRHHSPDLAIILGVKRQKENWASFFVAEEGVRPRILMEIVSPNTRTNDVEKKFIQYYQAKVPIYIIIDKEEEKGPWSIHGYQRTPRGYLPTPLDERGRLWIDELNLWLGLEDNRLVCHDGDTEEIIPDYTRLTEEFLDVKELLVEEKSLVQLEKAKVEAEKAKVEAEKAKVEAEKARADAAEHRARELEELLARRDGAH